MKRLVGVFAFSALTAVMSAYGWARAYLYLGALFGFGEGFEFRAIGMALSAVCGLGGLWVGFTVASALSVGR